MENIPDINSSWWSEILPNGWTRAHIFFDDNGYLPEGFNQWGIKTSDNLTLFEFVMNVDESMANSFTDWDMVITSKGETCEEAYERMYYDGFINNAEPILINLKTKRALEKKMVRFKDWDQCYEYIQENDAFPKGFDQWDLRRNENWETIAHVAARLKKLPDDFTQWDLRRVDGSTVAHEHALWKMKMPESFNQWDLADQNGWTVAHEIARWGTLPESFTQWEMVDRTGWTVAHEAIDCGRLPVKRFHKWYLKDNSGKGIKSTIAWLFFDKYILQDWYVKCFTDWDMVVGDEGQTCRDVYEEVKRRLTREFQQEEKRLKTIVEGGKDDIWGMDV